VTPHQRNSTLIAVDVGNSRIKLGRFEQASLSTALPVPMATLEMRIESRAGEFDAAPMDSWCAAHVAGDAVWRISSVHRDATAQWLAATNRLARQLDREWSLQPITSDDVPLAIEVDHPDRVGTDRLMAAVAANRLRATDRAAVVVDLGTAITVDLVTASGAFAGGAILPGLAMSARALEAETDALPRVAVDAWQRPPEPLGKSTVPAIESGLFWGAVGAVRELIDRLSVGLTMPPELFVTGGQASLVAAELASFQRWPVRHVPHLVLSGIALVDEPAGPKG
jgi:type III pantothenate kinase